MNDPKTCEIWYNIDLDKPEYIIPFQEMEDIYSESNFINQHIDLNLKDFQNSSFFMINSQNLEPLKLLGEFLDFVENSDLGLAEENFLTNAHSSVQSEINQLLPIVRYLANTNLKQNRSAQYYSKLKLEIIKLFKNNLIPGLDFFEKHHLTDITKQLQSMDPVHLIEYGTAATILNWSSKQIAQLGIMLSRFFIYTKYLLHPEIENKFKSCFESNSNSDVGKVDLVLYYRFSFRAKEFFPKLVNLLEQINPLKKRLESLRKAMAIVLTQSLHSCLDTEEGRHILKSRYRYLTSLETNRESQNLLSECILELVLMSQRRSRWDEDENIDNDSMLETYIPVSENTAGLNETDVASTDTNPTNQSDVKEMQLITNPPILESSKIDYETEPVTTINKAEIEDFLKEIEQASETKTKIHETASKKKSKPKAKRKKRKSQKARQLEREKLLLAQIEYDVSDTIDTKQVIGDFSSPSASAVASSMAEWNVQGKVPGSFETGSTEHSTEDTKYSNNNIDYATIKHSDNQSIFNDLAVSELTVDEETDFEDQIDYKSVLDEDMSHNKAEIVTKENIDERLEIFDLSDCDTLHDGDRNSNQSLSWNDIQNFDLTDEKIGCSVDSSPLYYSDSDTDDCSHTQQFLFDKNDTENQVFVKEDNTNNVPTSNKETNISDINVVKQFSISQLTEDINNDSKLNVFEKNHHSYEICDIQKPSFKMNENISELVEDKPENFPLCYFTSSDESLLLEAFSGQDEDKEVIHVSIPKETFKIVNATVNIDKEYEYEPTIVDTEAYKRSPFNIKNDKPINIITGSHEIYHYEAKIKKRNYAKSPPFELKPQLPTKNFKIIKRDILPYYGASYYPIPPSLHNQQVRKGYALQQQQMFSSYSRQPIFENYCYRYPQPIMVVQRYSREQMTEMYNLNKTFQNYYDQQRAIEKNNLFKECHHQQQQALKYHSQHQQLDESDEADNEEYYEILGTEDIRSPRNRSKTGTLSSSTTTSEKISNDSRKLQVVF